jgi:hypothetical protein
MKQVNALPEKVVETYLCEKVASAGGVAEKVQVIGSRGFFDRLVVLPGGRVVFCEVKKPRGGRLGVHQAARHDRYRALGAEVRVIKTLADVDFLIDRSG